MNEQERTSLERLCARMGVTPSYYDALGTLRQPSDEALVSVLRSLGAAVSSPADTARTLSELERAPSSLALEPVVVAWQDASSFAVLHGAADRRDSTAELELMLEDGESTRTALSLADLQPVEGRDGHAIRVPIPALPTGYHSLVVRLGSEEARSRVIAAPRRGFAGGPGTEQARWWGLFAPTYALRSFADGGIGTLAELSRLADWSMAHGATVVSTLPLLPVFLDHPYDPSPYAPISRCAWNELYIDLHAVPELDECQRARALLDEPEARRAEAEARRDPLVDYRRIAARRRPVLEALSAHFWSRSGERMHELEAWRAAHPYADAYARFRAAHDRHRAPWPDWPGNDREGSVAMDEPDPEAVRFYLYTQWLCDGQIAALGQRIGRYGPGLALDLPVGTHPDGFDTWHESALFARDTCTGAPPDGFFSEGQDWGLPPINPEASRRQGHRHFIECLRHHMRHAGVLRIDHVMGLHRLFWIPQGHPATDGVYVRYPAEELYAIVALESWRERCHVAGEDLGTVPDEVRAAMGDHGFLRLWVAQFEMRPEATPPIGAPPDGSLASLNTHDTPTLAGFLAGRDIDLRVELGLLGGEDAGREREQRARLRRSLSAYFAQLEPAPPQGGEDRVLLQALAEYLARGDARMVVLALEDLWLEHVPQNVPGTGGERSNWRRRMRYTLEEIERDESLARLLASLQR